VGDGEGLENSRIQNTDISMNANLNMDTEINPTLPNLSSQHSQNDTSISNEDSWAEMIANIRRRNKPPKLPRGGKSTKTNLTLGSLNINGRDSSKSMSSVGHKFSYLKQTMDENKIGILAIQESHLDVDGSVQFNNVFQRWFKIINSGHPTKPNSTAGVAFVLNKKFLDTDNYHEHVLIPGRALLISIPWHQGETLTLLNIYAPNGAAERRKLWDDLWEIWVSDHTLPLPDITQADWNLWKTPWTALPMPRMIFRPPSKG
jgi:hypothetical protein